MESMGGMEDADWSTLSGMYTTAEEANFMAQLLGGCGNSFWSGRAPGSSASDHEPSHYHSFDFLNITNTGNGENENNLGSSDVNNIGGTFSFSQESSSYSGIACGQQEKCYQPMEHVLSLDFTAEETADCNMEESHTNVQLSQDYTGAGFEQETSKTSDPMPYPSSVPRKRSRDYKNKKNGKTKRKYTVPETGNEEEVQNNGKGSRIKRQMSSCSINESNTSGESIDGSCAEAVNLDGKTRANRGAATDPQSLYARKRRERINERLRILQGLVPNGTKVDISTMLEEAVQYVKFLQLQIKLLSSDDLWMYAPIAYNGMDIGLDLKLTTPRS